MLPTPCRWIHWPDGASSLDWHYGCIGSVTCRSGRWIVTLQGWGVREEHPCASHGQGVRFLEKWVSARVGLPGFKRRVRR